MVVIRFCKSAIYYYNCYFCLIHHPSNYKLIPLKEIAGTLYSPLLPPDPVLTSVCAPNHGQLECSAKVSRHQAQLAGAIQPYL